MGQWAVCKLNKGVEIKKKVKVSILAPSYTGLYIGVHPSNLLSDKWFSFLCISTESDLKECLDEPLSSSSPERSEKDSDCDTQSYTWDYKRSRETIHEQ